MINIMNQESSTTQGVIDTVVNEMKQIYKTKLLPLEEHYLFHEFHSPKLDDADFEAKPIILMIGQYSTGKTTFLRYLLERDFPGMRIGPEPTTDRFIAVMHDEHEGIIPGNALVVDPRRQFRPLSKFGSAFLNRFQCSTIDSPVLKTISFVDTPGIFSGEKQSHDRGYDFTGVVEWFAERADRIILFFDAHKLDISDEFRRSIESLKGHDDKIRIILNKADLVDHRQLMRVYGALMWSLGKVLQTPEAARVYIGSFWNEPLHFSTNRRLFEKEQQDLFQDLQTLPRGATFRKLNDLLKRARMAKIHAYIIGEIHKFMPTLFGKESKKKELIKNLENIYERVKNEYNILPADFPDINRMKETLLHQDFSRFRSLKTHLINNVNNMVDIDIARLINLIQRNRNTKLPPVVKGGAFEDVLGDNHTPFGYLKGEGSDAGFGDHEWICNKLKSHSDHLFSELGPVGGKISGSMAKKELIKSNLPNSVLSKIWKLSDVDADGFLDSDEFALALHLINIKKDGCDLPPTLPEHLVPPSKRQTAMSVSHFEQEEVIVCQTLTG